MRDAHPRRTIARDYYDIRLQLSTADSETYKVREILRAYSRYETRVNSIRGFFVNARFVDVHIFKIVSENLYKKKDGTNYRR